MNNASLIKIFKNALPLLACLATYALAQEPTKNDRFLKAFIQLSSAIGIKKGLDNDTSCKAKGYKDFSLDEAFNSIPENFFKDDNEKLKMKGDVLPQFNILLETKLPDGRPMYQQVYQQTLTAYRQGGIIPNTNDGHCDVMYQAAGNIFQNAKNNLKLLDK